MENELFIIGAGPAGLTAAITAARLGVRVRILEKMSSPGKKLLATGNGRCNLTNKKMGSFAYSAADAGFVDSVLSSFSEKDTCSFFEGLGVSVHEKNGFVYPRSEQATTVLTALLSACRALGVKIECGSGVRRLLWEEEGFSLMTEEGRIRADRVILAAGSLAAPHTGSAGDAYELAQMTGHAVRKPLPALVQLRSSSGSCRQMAGARAWALCCLKIDGQEKQRVEGELQCVEYGLSGFPIFQLSSQAVRAVHEGRQVAVMVDFLPGLEERSILSELSERAKRLSYLTPQELLNGYLPAGIAGALVYESGVPAKKDGGELTQGELRRIVRQTKYASFPIQGYNSFDRAQTCSGGIEISQIHSKTMESKRVPGLYLAGECMDVDGICGGYNLQWAFATGAIAGRAAAESKRRKNRRG